jgi:hypothetical protein
MVHLLSGQDELEIDALHGDVLSQLPRRHGKPSPVELVVQLSRDQVQLPQIGLTRVAGTCERCCTVTAMCASSSTYNAASSGLLGCSGFFKV